MKRRKLATKGIPLPTNPNSILFVPLTTVYKIGEALSRGKIINSISRFKYRVKYHKIVAVLVKDYVLYPTIHFHFPSDHCSNIFLLLLSSSLITPFSSPPSLTIIMFFCIASPQISHLKAVEFMFFCLAFITYAGLNFARGPTSIKVFSSGLNFKA